MTRNEIIAAWNAQADDANGWHHLGEDEKLEWAIKLEREACAKVCENIYEGDEACGDWPSPEQCADAIRARGNA